MEKWIGLVSSDGKTEWNARFCIGSKAAETLECGKIYTYEYLCQIAGGYTVGRGKNENGDFQMVAVKGAMGLKESKKWRCER